MKLIRLSDGGVSEHECNNTDRQRELIRLSDGGVSEPAQGSEAHPA